MTRGLPWHLDRGPEMPPMHVAQCDRCERVVPYTAREAIVVGGEERAQGRPARMRKCTCPVCLCPADGTPPAAAAVVA